ncbi:Aquaporin-1 [Aphelenchoides besseyi]|nr:Aquaporin-1 [Aphelenchoides besseyi]
MNPRTADYDARNLYGTYPGKFSDFALRNNIDELQMSTDGPVRGILRKNQHRPAMYLNGYDYYSNNNDPQVIVKKVTAKKESKWSAVYDRLIRPCLAEVFVLCMAVFIYKHIETQITERQITFFTRILLLSAVDAAIVGIFLSAFETVQINPVITVAQLFSFNTPWYLCILLVGMQFVGGAFGTGLFYVNEQFTWFSNTQFQLAHTGMYPTLPKLVIDANDFDFTSSVTELIICQFVGTLAVCISFLMATQPVGTSRLYVARLVRSPLSVVSAVALSSFMSLLHSNISWNPVVAFSLSIYHFIKGSGGSLSWHNQFIFWLGPVLGALAACFLFRFILAPRDRRVQLCDNSPDYSV